MYPVTPAPVRFRARLCGAFFVTVVALAAQTTQPPSSTAPQNKAVPPVSPVERKDKVVVLDPFEVTASGDTGFAASTTSLTRFNVSLFELPASADILDKKFMDSVAAATLEDLFMGYAAGSGMVLGTPESDSNSNQPGDYYGSGQFSIRGLSAGVPRRNGFNSPATSYNTTTIFDVEEVSVLRGSQGLLYGPAGAAGMVNVTTKLARFDKTSAEVQERIDKYGSRRSILDVGWGNHNIALRFSSTFDHQNYRRLFINDRLEGYYAQLALRLPLNTTLRISAEKNHDHRIVPSTTNGTNPVTLNAAGEPAALNDPRNGWTLAYLLATGTQGANDPVTGAAYPRGQILNFPLTTENYQSLAGWRSAHATTSQLFDATLDTVWTPWLSSQVGVASNLWDSWRNVNGFKGVFAPPVNGLAVGGNPLPGWSAQYNSPVSTGDTNEGLRWKSFRASLLATNKFWNGRIVSRTGVGFDSTYQYSGRVDYGYYQANSNGALIYDPSATGTNLGRIPAPAYWWDITNGPVGQPFGQPFIDTVTINGVNYVRSPQNMRDPSWVGPNNPLGLESLARDASGNLLYKLGGGNNNNTAGLTSYVKNQGWYVSNYTEWFGNRFNTLLGIRRSSTYRVRPNTTASVQDAFITSGQLADLPSYNAGFSVRLKSWLRGYYSFSETFNSGGGATDPLGKAVPTTLGLTHEAGLKFVTPNGRFEGSIAAYEAKSQREQFNIGSTLLNTINPAGLNGSYNGPDGGKNSWVIIDKVSRGLELILTAQPMKGWSSRLVATISDGTIKSDSTYPILYNDQFTTDGHGNVTYNNGQPFLVPTDSTNLAKVSTLNNVVNPNSAFTGATMVPLTIAMINDPSSPYYVWSGQAEQTANGQIPSATNLYRVLNNFNNGSTALTGKTGLSISEIQYAWADPNNYQGTFIAAQKGQATVGYPVYKISFTNHYTFSEGRLRGFGIGGTVNLAWDNRTYFYRTPDQAFHLWSAPLVSPQVNATISYRHKFNKVTYSSQISISNLFNHYTYALAPNNGAGFTPTTAAGTLYGEPRAWVWTNTLSF